LLELLAGLLIGYALALLPWAIALLSGTAVITERLDMNYWAILILAAAFFLLFTQAVMEEITNRAFPMRLWAHRSFLFRIIVPSIFFAAIHLAGEQFAFERFGILFAAGIAQSLAYALTGNIWFTSGVHAGANYAIFSISGLWYAGALVNVAGQPAFPHWLTVMIILIFLSLIYGFRRRYKPLVVTNPADLSAR
jgi:membrane protease YdiL (CAAX protease family)